MTAQHVVSGPRWNRADHGELAHLVADTVPPRLRLPGASTLDSRQSWCGTEVGGREAAPYAKRCKVCIANLNRYVKAALVPPPELVTETVTIKVTRPADSVGLLGVVQAAAHKRKGWTVGKIYIDETGEV